MSTRKDSNNQNLDDRLSRPGDLTSESDRSEENNPDTQNVSSDVEEEEEDYDDEELDDEDFDVDEEESEDEDEDVDDDTKEV